MKRMLLFSAIAHLVLVWVMVRSLPLLPEKRTDSTVYMVKVVESIPPPSIEKAQVSQPVQIDSYKAKETQTSKVREISLEAARKKLTKREELEALREKIVRKMEAESREVAEERRSLQAWKQEMESRKTVEITAQPGVSPGRGTWGTAQPEVSSGRGTWGTAQPEVSPGRGTWGFPSWYVDLIHNKAFANWTPPARVMTREVCVSFEISRDGRIGNVGVEKTSKDHSFDEIALLAVKKLEPLPPLPGEFPGNSLKVHLTFRQTD
jgi:TonB family protein